MSLIEQLARPEILALEPYSHASWDPALERLHANENPWRYPDDRSEAGLNRYPEPHPHVLESRLATLYGVRPEQVLAGRGSDEGIDLLTRAFLRPGRDAALICPPTFGMYAVATRIQGAAVVEVPLRADAAFALDEPAVFAALSPAVRLLFLCMPGNPTGAALDPRVLERLLARTAESAIVVIDEAYAEFASAPSFASRLAEFPNLVVLRTLSKAYALAGARIGAVIAAPELIALLRRIVPPYAIATPAAEAALSALAPANLAEAAERIAALRRARGMLAAGLAALPLVSRVWPSEANFLLVESPEPAELMRRARAAGFLLRDFSRGRHTPGCLRITVGSAEQNDRLLTGLAAR